MVDTRVIHMANDIPRVYTCGPYFEAATHAH